MPRLRYPRIAAHTLAKPDKPFTPNLKPLPVGIYRNGELRRIEELPDPRAGFIREFNEHSEELGLSARMIGGGK